MGNIRIIGGRARGTKLKVTDRPGLRPTSDRIRETLFNWLAPMISGATCLDLFAGTGALGLEALSRGASFVVFVERDLATARELQEQLKRLKFENARVEIGDALSLIPQLKEHFDLVFLDPPFQSELLQKSFDALINVECFNPESMIYREYDRSLTLLPLPEPFEIYRNKTTERIVYELVTQKSKCA